MSDEVKPGQRRRWKRSGEEFEVVEFRQSTVGDFTVGVPSVEIQNDSGATRVTTVATVRNNSVVV